LSLASFTSAAYVFPLPAKKACESIEQIE